MPHAPRSTPWWKIWSLLSLLVTDNLQSKQLQNRICQNAIFYILAGYIPINEVPPVNTNCSHLTTWITGKSTGTCLYACTCSADSSSEPYYKHSTKRMNALLGIHRHVHACHVDSRPSLIRWLHCIIIELFFLLRSTIDKYNMHTTIFPPCGRIS